MKKITEGSSFYIIEENILMPDGVRLYTRSVVPKDLKKCLIIFKMMPYEKTLSVSPLRAEEYKANDFVNAHIGFL